MWQVIRQKALKRDNFLCLKCGNAGQEVDHITPLCLGGTDSLDNLQTLCDKCHKKKTSKDIRLKSMIDKYNKQGSINKILGGM